MAAGHELGHLRHPRMQVETHTWQRGPTWLIVSILAVLTIIVICMVPCLLFGFMGSLFSKTVEDTLVAELERQAERRNTCETLKTQLPRFREEPHAAVGAHPAIGPTSVVVASNLSDGALLRVDIVDNEGVVVREFPDARVGQGCAFVLGLGELRGDHTVRVSLANLGADAGGDTAIRLAGSAVISWPPPPSQDESTAAQPLGP